MGLIKITPNKSDEGYESDAPNPVNITAFASISILARDITAATTNDNFQVINVKVSMSPIEPNVTAKLRQTISVSADIKANIVNVVSPISVNAGPTVMSATVKTFGIATEMKPNPLVLTSTVPGAYFTNSFDATINASMTSSAPNMTLTGVERLGLLVYEYNDMNSELTEIKHGELNA